MIGERLGVVVQIVLIVVLLAVVLSQLLGQPVLLSYVTSDSMAPTIGEGDGFVALPAELSGGIQEGDVVVFQAAAVNDGELTTHRIVGRADRGFITQGDANPVTDQADGDPPVSEPQVVAKAFELDGSPVTIPALGTVVVGVQDTLGFVQSVLADVFDTGAFLGTQGLAYILLGLTTLLYGLDRWLRRGRDRARRTDRDTGTNTLLAIGMMAMAIVLAATLLMVVPSGTYEHEFVSSSHDTPGADVIGVGETESLTLSVQNGGLAPVAVFFEPEDDRVAVEPGELRIPGESAASAHLTVTAPAETGAYRTYLTEHRYLGILPQDHLRALYSMHPWLPIIVIDGLLGLSFYLVGISLIGTGRIRRRDRDSPGIGTRIVARLT